MPRIVFESGPLQILQVAAGQQHVAIAGDDGQQVVEIVGDSSGEPPDRLHLLRLAELLFETIALSPHSRGSNLALDCGVQAHQVAACEMVGGARLQDG